MTRIDQLHWFRELLWWIFTIIVAVAVILPAGGFIRFDFLWVNILYVVVTVTFIRYIVFLNHVPYLKGFWVRVALLVISMVVFWQFMRQIQDFLYAIDNYTISAFLTKDVMFETNEHISNIYQYFKKEYIVFSTASEMLIIILVFRLVYSFWGNEKKW